MAYNEAASGAGLVRAQAYCIQACRATCKWYCSHISAVPGMGSGVCGPNGGRLYRRCILGYSVIFFCQGIADKFLYIFAIYTPHATQQPRSGPTTPVIYRFFLERLATEVDGVGKLRIRVGMVEVLRRRKAANKVVTIAAVVLGALDLR